MCHSKCSAHAPSTQLRACSTQENTQTHRMPFRKEYSVSNCCRNRIWGLWALPCTSLSRQAASALVSSREKVVTWAQRGSNAAQTQLCCQGRAAPQNQHSCASTSESPGKRCTQAVPRWRAELRGSGGWGTPQNKLSTVQGVWEHPRLS